MSGAFKQLQMNPNNNAFWQARGLIERPGNWQDEVKRMKNEGLLTAAANLAAAKSPARKQLIGTVTRKVEHAAKEILGGHAKVHHKGSVKKRTDIAATHDLDLWIELPKASPVTKKQKQKLAVELRKDTRTFKRVLNQEWSLMLECKDGLKVDVIPQHTTFRHSASSRPTKGFGNNPRARDAVRILKDKHPNRWKGKDIEIAVQQAQTQRRRMPNFEIAERAEVMLSIL